MRNTFFLLLFLISGACFSQNPDPFWDGIRTKLVQPDTLSTFDRDALTPKLGTILYHKDTGVSRWEQWDGTDWIEFGGDTSGFVTLDTDQTITGLKTFDNDVIADNLYIGTSSAISGSKIHVNKISSDGSTSVSSFISNENTLSGISSNITYGSINRTFFSGSGTTGEVWGAQMIGRNSGSGTTGTLIGSNSLAELSGAGTSSNLYGSFSNTKINGSGSSNTTTALGGWDRVEINNPLSSVENIYGTYSNVDLIGGTVTNQAVASFLDFDFVSGNAADVSVNNLYYIKANADNLPTTTGEAYFIKAEVDLPSLFTGGIEANSFIKSSGLSTEFLKADGSVDNTTYLPSSSYTAADVLAKLLTVDGSGSGLDADLLDGVNGSTYARKDQNNNFTTSQTITGNITNSGIIDINNGTDISPDAAGSGQLTIAGNAYRGYIALDATGMHIGNNSSARNVTIDINETTRFSINNSGNLTATGAGEFGGTVSGSDPVNNDDFVTKGYAESNFATVESGTFTPTLIDAGGGATYSGTFTGQYVKIGPLVTIILGFVGIGTTGTPTGTLEIGNLPYTVSLASSGSVSEFFGGNVNFYSIASQSVPNITNRIRFIIQQALDSSLATNMSTVTISSGQIRTTISYTTND